MDKKALSVLDALNWLQDNYERRLLNVQYTEPKIVIGTKIV